jgi:hypothetical protein
MLKHVLLATTVALAVPAFAQDTPETPAPATQQQTAPAPVAPGEATTPQDSTDPAPVTTETAPPLAESATEGASAPATPATPAQPATPAEPATPTTESPAAETPPQAVTPQPSQTDPAPAQQPTTTTTPQAQTSPAQTAPAQPAPAQTAQQPATSQDQVAQAVGKEFGAYDKDANGGLDKTEFQTWMAALRKASEPTFSPDTPEATAWFGQAFTLADADKNAAVNQVELTTFLTPKPAA